MSDTRTLHHLGEIEALASMAPIHDPNAEMRAALRRIAAFAQRQCDADTGEALLWAQVVSMATAPRGV